MPTLPSNPGAGLRPDKGMGDLRFPVDAEPTDQGEEVEGVVQIARFKAMYARMATGKYGDLVLTFIIPKSDKLAGVLVSDHPNAILEVAVFKAESNYSEDVQKALQDMGIGLNAAPEL